MSEAYLQADCTLNGQSIEVTAHEVASNQHWSETLTLDDGAQEHYLANLPGRDAHSFYLDVNFDVVDAYPELHELALITTDQNHAGEVELGGNVTYTCSRGGTVRVIGAATELGQTGVTHAGFAFWNDLYINADVDCTINIGLGYSTTSIVEHKTGNPIIEFELTARSPNGLADIRVRGLKPNSWYRLQFNGVLAKTAGGRAHGKTDSSGVIEFSNVELPT